MIVNYRYWNKIRNCGDAVMAYILRHVLDATPRVARAAEPHLLGIGSILFLANRQSTIWGSGIADPDHLPFAIDPAAVAAMRGKLSLAYLRNNGVAVGDVPLGDPGILVSRLATQGVLPPAERRHRVAVVPHHRSLATPEFAALAGRDDVRVVNMRDSSLQPVIDIANADVVISQSLHGLVFATALGKPNLWIANPEQRLKRFKYDDWFTTVDNPQAEPLPNGTDLDELVRLAELRPSRIDEDALLASFPWGRVASDSTAPLADFAVARAAPVTVLRDDWLGEAIYLDPRAGSAERPAAATERVRAALEWAYAAQGEPHYLLLAPHGFAVAAGMLERLAGIMDSQPNIASLQVLDRAALAARGLPAARFPAWKAVRREELVGGALLLRTPLFYDGQRRFAFEEKPALLVAD